MTRPCLLLFAGLLAILSGSAAGTDKAQFLIEDGRAFIDQERVMVTTQVKHRFSDAALEALENGVALEVATEAELIRERVLWWDEVVNTASRRFALEYHALANQYVLRSLTLGGSRTFRSLAPLLAELNASRQISLGPTSLLQPDNAYRVRVRARLDIESLPAPLRPTAYVSEAWRLDSGWREWVLQWRK